MRSPETGQLRGSQSRQVRSRSTGLSGMASRRHPRLIEGNNPVAIITVAVLIADVLRLFLVFSGALQFPTFAAAPAAAGIHDVADRLNDPGDAKEAAR